MSKLIKKIEVPNCASTSIFKRERSKFWQVKFYVTSGYNKNGIHQESLKTENQREALKKAKEIYRAFDFDKQKQNAVKTTYFSSLALPFLNRRIKKFQFQKPDEKTNTGHKDMERYKREIDETLGLIDYRNIDDLTDGIQELVVKLKTKGTKTGRPIKDTTISKYMNIISLICNDSIIRGHLKGKPIIPTMQRINEERPPYFPKEVKQITLELINEYRRTKDSFYDEMSDYINFLRSIDLRPGKEPLMIKMNQCILINNTEQKDQVLMITLPYTKTKRKHSLTVNPNFTKELYFNKVLPRHKRKVDDYLFFPNEKNREKLVERVRKNFVRISRELGLYYFNNKPRPLYSIRHMNFTERYKKGVSMDKIANMGNTSPEMLRKNYITPHNQTNMLDIHNEYYSTEYKSLKKK